VISIAQEGSDMKIGDTVHVPSPSESNENWSVYRVGEIVAINDDMLDVELQHPKEVVTVPCDDALTTMQFHAYLLSARSRRA